MVEFDGLIRITGQGGESIDVTGEGSRLRADVASFSVGRPTLRLVSSSFGLVRRLARVLTRRKLTLLVTRSGEPFVELGAEARGGVAERLLRMPRVRIYRRK